MATEIVTRILCDLCALDDKDNDDASTLGVAINGQAFEIDLCGEHASTIIMLQETLAEHGRKIPKHGGSGNGKKSGSNGGPGGDCPVCGKSYAYRQSLTSHVRRVHGETLAEASGGALEHACRWCERKFGTPQGVAVHEQRAHNDEWKSARESADS